MNAADLLADLRVRGVTVTAGNGRLRVEAPKGVITEELRQALISHKAKLIKTLQQFPATQDSDCHNGTANDCRATTVAAAITTPPDSNSSLSFPCYAARSVPPTITEWSTEMSELTNWLASTVLPTEPFRLHTWSHVVDPDRFLASLHQDIAQGPSGPRARSGALLAQLKRVWTLFGPQQQSERDRDAGPPPSAPDTRAATAPPPSWWYSGPALMSLLIDEDELEYLWDERAAIAEYDGKLPSSCADGLASQCLGQTPWRVLRDIMGRACA